MKIEDGVIIASDGKVFRRKGTNDIYGNEIILGYSHYIDGVLQSPPHLDSSYDFEEIDDPNIEFNETI